MLFTLFTSTFLCCYLASASTSFRYLSYEEITNASYLLTGRFAVTATAAEQFGIRSSKEGNFECSPSIIRLADTSDLTSRPQVLLSGEIHGDELVGPLSSIAVAQMLVWSAECVIQKNQSACSQLEEFGKFSAAQKIWLAHLATRRDIFIIPTANCIGYKFRRRNDAKGIDPNRDFSYVRNDNRCFLSTTAKIFHDLMINNVIQVVVTFHGGMVAIGYEWGSKNHLSPRDASPDHRANMDISKIMQSFGGKFQNEGLYPVGKINSLVYPVDGGMEDWMYAAGWDEQNVKKSCLGLQDESAYVNNQTRTLRHRLPRPSSHRIPSKNHRHLAAATKKSLSGNRALVFLVETSDAKQPALQSLGHSDDVLNPSNTKTNGHVPRNIRVALTAIDMVQPYVCFNHLTILDVESDIKVEKLELSLDWYIGGAVSVESTFLTIAPAPPAASTTTTSTKRLSDEQLDALLQASHVGEGGNHMDKDSEETLFNDYSELLLSSVVVGGKSRWYETSGHHPYHYHSTNKHEAGKEYDVQYTVEDPLKPKSLYSFTVSMEKIVSYMKLNKHFSSSLHAQQQHGMAGASTGEVKQLIQIVAWSRVDSAVSDTVGQGYPELLSPQSYYSNLRNTDKVECRTVISEQSSTSNRKAATTETGKENRCEGHKYWNSLPLVLEITFVNHSIVLVKQLHAIEHCAHWNLPTTTTSMQATSDGKVLFAGSYSLDHGVPTNASSSDANKKKRLKFTEHKEKHLQTLFSSDTGYIIAFIGLLIFGSIVSMIVSCWRRSRIYSSVRNNPYLSLPSAFHN